MPEVFPAGTTEVRHFMSRPAGGRSRWRRILVSSVALFLAYVVLAQASYELVIPPNKSAVFWLPTGLAFPLFVRARWAPWLWPGWLSAIALAQFALAWYHGIPIAVALAWSGAALLVPMTATLLARRLVAEPFGLQRIRDILVLVALIAASVVPGALVAAAAALLGLDVPGFTRFALSWATSDALGIILLAPVILTWSARHMPPAGGAVEMAALILAMTLSAWAVFRALGPTILDPSLPSLPLLLVAWASIRFGPRATALAMLFLDFVMVRAACDHTGPFADSVSPEAVQLLNLQLLEGNLGLLMLLLAAAIEEQRAARSVAEEAIRVRDEFLSVASHELHTPLTSLQLAAQGLLAGKVQRPEAVTRFVALIDRQVQKLTMLIGELLDSTRIREGRIELKLEDVDLAAVARDVVGRVASVADQNGSTLTLEADREIHGHWDRMRLEQILTNLLSNAAKFGGGKPIAVTVGLATLDVAQVVVQDSGIGIPSERLPHIFDRFEQAVAQRHYGGLGLGLYIVRSLTELLGGSVAAVSTPGVGSTFTVRLPLRSRSGPRGSSSPRAGQVWRGNLPRRGAQRAPLRSGRPS